MRDRDERDVVVPAAVGAAFEVIETERVFELAIVVLDPPAQLREPNELLERRVRGEIGRYDLVCFPRCRLRAAGPTTREQLAMAIADHTGLLP